MRQDSIWINSTSMNLREFQKQVLLRWPSTWSPEFRSLEREWWRGRERPYLSTILRTINVYLDKEQRKSKIVRERETAILSEKSRLKGATAFRKTTYEPIWPLRRKSWSLIYEYTFLLNNLSLNKLQRSHLKICIWGPLEKKDGKI